MVRRALQAGAFLAAASIMLAVSGASGSAKEAGEEDKRPVIVIDAGHGGTDPGAVGAGGTLEKDVTLAFAIALKAVLERSGTYEVRLTRHVDVAVTIVWRYLFAKFFSGNEARRGLVLSVHADAVPRGFGRGTRGASVYTYAEEGEDDEARLLAALNRASGAQDPRGRVDVTPSKKSNRQLLEAEIRRREHSTRFARILIDALDGQTALRWNRPRLGDYSVLAAPSKPAVLLELGFLTNRADEAQLRSPAWRDRIAEAVAGAIDAYFRDATAEKTSTRGGETVNKAQKP